MSCFYVSSLRWAQTGDSTGLKMPPVLKSAVQDYSRSKFLKTVCTQLRSFDQVEERNSHPNGHEARTIWNLACKYPPGKGRPKWDGCRENPLLASFLPLLKFFCQMCMGACARTHTQTQRRMPFILSMTRQKLPSSALNERALQRHFPSS